MDTNSISQTKSGNEGQIGCEACIKKDEIITDMYEALEAWGELWEMRPLDSGADMQHILKRCWGETIKAIAKADRRE